jgi:hypothetical protein
MSAEEVAARMEAGHPVTVLDARSPQAWGESRQKVRGASASTERVSASILRGPGID